MEPNAHGPAPFGWQMQVTRELVPVPHEQHILWLAAHLRRRGWSFQKVADVLDLFGLRTRAGARFTKQSLSLLFQKREDLDDLADTG